MVNILVMQVLTLLNVIILYHLLGGYSVSSCGILGMVMITLSLKKWMSSSYNNTILNIYVMCSYCVKLFLEHTTVNTLIINDSAE